MATPEEPVHALSQTSATFDGQEDQRRRYDQYLNSLDAELLHLLEHFRTSRLLDTSNIIFTSEQGELFERGEIGHYSCLIYDPIIREPLIISCPSQKQQIDAQTPTGNVDLLPTIASLIGSSLPNWDEGQLLPEFGRIPDQNRDIYAMDAKSNSAFTSLT